MIVDSLQNIHIYQTLSKDIITGLDFIKNAVTDIELGEYEISTNAKAIVTEYETIECFERGYEAHKHVIDIQYPVIGKERIKWSPLPGMSIISDYDEVKDRAFYINPSQITSVDIGQGIYAIFFPEDTHSPQHYINKPELIKKITVKVSIN